MRCWQVKHLSKSWREKLAGEVTLEKLSEAVEAALSKSWQEMLVCSRVSRRTLPTFPELLHLPADVVRLPLQISLGLGEPSAETVRVEAL